MSTVPNPIQEFCPASGHVFIFWSPGPAQTSFPCWQWRTFHPLAHEFEGTFERVSPASTESLVDGDVRLCPEGHIALYGQHRSNRSRAVGPGGSMPQGTTWHGWECLNLDCEWHLPDA
jgi:hypothetical protein